MSTSGSWRYIISSIRFQAKKILDFYLYPLWYVWESCSSHILAGEPRTYQRPCLLFILRLVLFWRVADSSTSSSRAAEERRQDFLSLVKYFASLWAQPCYRHTAIFTVVYYALYLSAGGWQIADCRPLTQEEDSSIFNIVSMHNLLLILNSFIQMRAIKEELGDTDEDEDDIVALDRKLQSSGMPANVWKHTQRELRYVFIL